MIKPTVKPVVKLVGEDGNAFFIIGKVKAALKKAGADKEYIDEFITKAKSGNYSQLLCVCMDYTNIK